MRYLNPTCVSLCWFFFNDILIFSKTWDDHLSHVCIIFELLCAHNLYLKKSRCFFGESQVAYLGHVVSATGVAVDASKVQAITDWPQPQSITALRGFLGVAGYYRKFIKNYSQLSAPLTNMLKRNSF